MNNLEDENLSHQLKYSKEFFKKHNVIIKCPICTKDNFVVEDTMGMDSYDFKKNKKLDFYLPLVVLTCKNCGYVMNFSAQQMGLIDNMP